MTNFTLQSCHPLQRGYWIFSLFIYVIQHWPICRPHTVFHCVGGCWDRTQDCWQWQTDALSNKLDLIHCPILHALNPFFFKIHFLCLFLFPFLSPFYFYFLTILTKNISLFCLICCLVVCSFRLLAFHFLYFFLVLYTHYKKHETHFFNFLHSLKFMFPTVLKSGIPDIRNVFIRIRGSVTLDFLTKVAYQIWNIRPYF